VDTLDALAETMDRDRSYLLNEAVERYLELNEYHIRLIKKGLRAAKEGRLISHADVKKNDQQNGPVEVSRADVPLVDHARHETIGRCLRIHRR
jgi:predicted transcriptional regulator